MKALLAAALVATSTLLAGCDPNNPENLKAEFADANTGKPLTLAAVRRSEAIKLCGERYRGLMQTEVALYGQYSDFVGLLDDAKSCMARHGVRVLGWRQKDGRLTQYPHSPKYLEY